MLTIAARNRQGNSECRVNACNLLRCLVCKSLKRTDPTASTNVTNTFNSNGICKVSKGLGSWLIRIMDAFWKMLNHNSFWNLFRFSSPNIHMLHWLPVRRRVDFKRARYMYNSLHGRIPRYLSGDCQLIADASRRLQSSDTFTFAVPRTNTCLGDRSFAIDGPQIWNSLPADLRLADNYARFRRLLKGHIFGWGCGA